MPSARSVAAFKSRGEPERNPCENHVGKQEDKDKLV